MLPTPGRRRRSSSAAPDPDRVIFTSNATDALNIALQGMLKPGDHVVSTRLEHNSVLRPLYHLRLKGVIEYDLVPFDGNGFVDPEEIAAAMKPNTRLVVMTHASNVLGTIQPISEVGRLCAARDVPLADRRGPDGRRASPSTWTSWNVAALAFTGHKSMLGPTGIGGLVLNEGIEWNPFGSAAPASIRRPLYKQSLFPTGWRRNPQSPRYHRPFRSPGFSRKKPGSIPSMRGKCTCSASCGTASLP